MRSSIQQSKALFTPEKCPTNLAPALLLGLRRKKADWSEITFSLKNLPVRALDSSAQGFSTPVAHRRSIFPPPSPNLVHTLPIERYKALRDCAPCLSCATTSKRAPKWSSKEARTWGTTSLTNHTAAASQPTG